MKTPKFQYWKGRDGNWFCHLISRNGRITIPPEGMYRRSGIKKAIASAVKAANDALTAGRIEEIEDPNPKATWDNELGHQDTK